MGLPLRKTETGFTYKDYKTWPEEERWELIHGVAYNMSAAANRYHQGISGAIFAAFYNYLKDKSCKVYAAAFDVLLPESQDQEEDDVDTVVQPDISVICDRSKLTKQGCTGAPDLAVEILSPYTSRKDIEIKTRLYEEHGVREYWIVDPGNRYVHVYILDACGRYPLDPAVYLEEHTLPCAVLPELSINLTEVFAELD